MRDFFETLGGFFIFLQLLMGAWYAITHLTEFITYVLLVILGLTSFFCIFGAPMYIGEKLLSDNKDEKTGSQILKGCGYFLLGICLLPVVSNIDPKGNSTSKSSPPRTYVHEDFDSSTRSYSAPKQDYRPIEFSKTESPPALFNSKNTGDTLKDLGITNPPNVESYSEMQSRLQAEREEFLREWEAESEARWREIEAKHQAEQEKLQAEFEADRKKRAKEHEDFLEKLEQDRLAVERQLEESRYRHHSSAFYTPESVRSLVPEPIPFYTEPELIPQQSDSLFVEMP